MKSSCRSKQLRRVRHSLTMSHPRSLPFLDLARVAIQNRSETRSFVHALSSKSHKRQKNRKKETKKNWWRRKKPLELSLKHTCAPTLPVQLTCRAGSSVWSFFRSTETTLILFLMSAKLQIWSWLSWVANIPMLEVSNKTHSNTPKLLTRLAIALCTYFVVRVCHPWSECCNTWRTSLQASKAKSKSCSSACTPVNLLTSTNSWCSTMWTSHKCQMTRMLFSDRLLSPTHNTSHPKRTDPTWWVKSVMCAKMRFTLKATSDRTSWMQND